MYNLQSNKNNPTYYIRDQQTN